jgi:WD40 repeat protein
MVKAGVRGNFRANPSVQPLLGLLQTQVLKPAGDAAPLRPLTVSHLTTSANVMAGGRNSFSVISGGNLALPDHQVFAPMSLAADRAGRFLALGGAVIIPPTLQKPRMEQVGAVLVWDLKDGKIKALLRGHDGIVTTVAFSRDGQTLASGGADGTVRLWDLTAARQRATLQGHVSPVLTLAFSGDGNRLASASSDGMVKVWLWATTRLEAEFKGHREGVTGMAWLPGDKTLVSASLDGAIKVWDLAAQLPVVKAYEVPLDALAFTPDSAALVGVDRLGWLQVDEIGKAAPRPVRHKLETGAGFLAQPAFPGQAAVAADARTVAVPDLAKWVVRLFDTSTGKQRSVLPRPAGTAVLALAFAPEGRTLAVASGVPGKSGEIRLHNLVAGKEPRVLAGYRNPVRALAWSRDGKTLAGAARDGTVKLWDVVAGNERLTFQAGAAVRALALCPVSGRLAVAAGQAITVREAATSKVLVKIPTYMHEATSLAFSPDGGRLLSGGGEGEKGRGGGVKLWDSTTGLELLSLNGPSDRVTCVAFSPDGRHIAAARIAGQGAAFLAQVKGEVVISDGRPPARDAR